MKKFILIALAFILFSCNDDSPEPAVFTTSNPVVLDETWILVSMSGNLANSVTTGTDMEWQEEYKFELDGTFVKTRDQDGETTTSSGTYAIIDSFGKRYIQLIHSKESDIIGTCNSDLREEMIFKSQSTFSSTWQACDGPGLNYEKTAE